MLTIFAYLIAENKKTPESYQLDYFYSFCFINLQTKQNKKRKVVILQHNTYIQYNMIVNTTFIV